PGAGLAALGITCGPGRTARGAGAAELPSSNLTTPAGKLGALEAGAGYQVGDFPIALRLTPPDASWAGAQWKTSSHGRPAFGWAAVGQGPVNGPPLGLIEIETAFRRRPRQEGRPPGRPSCGGRYENGFATMSTATSR